MVVGVGATGGFGVRALAQTGPSVGSLVNTAPGVDVGGVEAPTVVVDDEGDDPDDPDDADDGGSVGCVGGTSGGRRSSVVVGIAVLVTTVVVVDGGSTLTGGAPNRVAVDPGPGVASAVVGAVAKSASAVAAATIATARFDIFVVLTFRVVPIVASLPPTLPLAAKLAVSASPRAQHRPRSDGFRPDPPLPVVSFGAEVASTSRECRSGSCRRTSNEHH